MNSRYKSKIKIFEDFFDDEEISGTVSDVSEPDSDGLPSDSNNDKPYIPRHQLCLFLQNPMTLYPLSEIPTCFAITGILEKMYATTSALSSVIKSADCICSFGITRR